MTSEEIMGGALAEAVRAAVAAERARCAAVCRAVAARGRVVVCSGPWRVEGEGRGDGARECAEAIERGAVGR
jgi:hypothetical protein